MSTTQAQETVAVQPLSGSLKLLALPNVCVKIAMGAKILQRPEGWIVSFDGAMTRLHEQDLRTCQKVATKLRHKLPQGGEFSISTVLDLAGYAHKFLSEEIFFPDSVRVIYFPSVVKASAFYRCWIPAGAMARGTRVAPHVSRDRIGREALEYDVVVIQIDSSPGAFQFAKALKELGKKVVFEIDDAFDALEPWHPQYDYYSSAEGKEQVRRMMGVADLVTVTTPFLKERYIDLARKIEVLPNFIPFHTWPVSARHATDEFRILWAGSPSHMGDFEVLDQALFRFSERHPGTRLVFFGREPGGIHVAQEQLRYIPFCEFEEYPVKLAGVEADVAIASLADIPFNWGKSNIKYLEYATAGYPVIASNVGPYAASIKNGVNGFLCDAESHWLEALEAMYQDRDLRRSIAVEGRLFAKEFDVDKNRVQIENVYAGLLGR